MGWVVLILLGLAVAAGLWLLGVPRLLWTSVGAALMLAATGYVLQGSPDVAEHAATPATESVRIDADDIELRDEMFGTFHNGISYLGAADALIRAGQPRTAAQAALGGVRRYPNNAALWTELGSTLSASDGGAVSPSALFAFTQAKRLAPGHPAPYYFLGLAYLSGGQLQAARDQWTRALRLTPANAAYRGKIIERLQLIDQFIQMNSQAAPAG
ncbi:MAG: hypothetical protein K2P68_04040 [Sphingomonas sp.]|nr:hypothetical protein [Sphingomonas sp.]